MKFLKSEKWKLEEATRCICLLVSIFYGFAIFLGGLINIIDFVADFLPSELYDVFDSVTKILNFLIVVLLYVSLILYITKLIYVIPVIVTIFLISVAFTELVKRKNPRVFVHPLVVFSIVISFIGSFGIIHFVENSF